MNLRSRIRGVVVVVAVGSHAYFKFHTRAEQPSSRHGRVLPSGPVRPVRLVRLSVFLVRSGPVRSSAQRRGWEPGGQKGTESQEGTDTQSLPEGGDACSQAEWLDYELPVTGGK